MTRPRLSLVLAFSSCGRPGNLGSWRDATRGRPDRYSRRNVLKRNARKVPSGTGIRQAPPDTEGTRYQPGPSKSRSPDRANVTCYGTSNELSHAGSDGRRPSIAGVRMDGRQPRTERPSARAALKDVHTQQRPAGLWQSKSAIHARRSADRRHGPAIRDTEDADGWAG